MKPDEAPLHANRTAKRHLAMYQEAPMRRLFVEHHQLPKSEPGMPRGRTKRSDGRLLRLMMSQDDEGPAD
jgi:hypothetical protein